MKLWIEILKRALLASITALIAFAWTSSTGRAQSVAGPCLIERGQDPLDVLNSGLRNNVWLIVDTSGSMGSIPTGATVTKLQQAKNDINRLMNEIVDGAGRPLVNWGIVNYAVNVPSGTRCTLPATAADDKNGDTYPDKPGGCGGLNEDSFVNPGTCSLDSRPAVKTILNGLLPGGATPIGTAFAQIASYMVGNGLVKGNTQNFVTGLLTNQKNYVIHLTDGVDTCECDAGGYPGTLGGTVATPVNMRPDPFNPNITQTSTDPNDYSSYNAGLKAEFALKKIDPALDGSKGNIFVIGFDINNVQEKTRVSTIAWMASGAHLVPQRDPKLMNHPYFARAGSDDLLNAFRDILARIGIPQSEVTLGSPIVSSVKEVIVSHTDTDKATADVFPASLTNADQIREARKVRADHRNNVLFTTSVEVPGFRGHLRATNIYKVTDSRLPRTEREPDFTELWDAGVELQNRDPSSRLLFFNKRGSKLLLPFTAANVTPVDLGVAAGYLNEADGTGAKTASDARDIVLNVMMGYRLSVDPGTKTIYKSDGTLNFSTTDASGKPTWKLYESTGGAVAVVSNPPRSPDFDPPLAHSSKYGVGGTIAGDGFYWDLFNRRTVVYYTSNAGVLHAFDAETGFELMGYIPDDVMSLDPAETVGSRSTLKDFVRLVVSDNNGVLNHQFTLSSSPNVEDVFLRSDRGGDDQWHTLLVFGRGRGGRFLTALDVTNLPSNVLSTKLLWNVGNREGIVETGYDGLGETWSIPVLGPVDTRTSPTDTGDRVDQWLVFAGGGYGCDNATQEGQFLFAFRAEDGAIYHRAQITGDRSAAIAYDALPATPTLFNPHEVDSADGKDFVTRVYIPDLQGRVWKMNTSNTNSSSWTMNVFAEMGIDHPITAAVTVMNDKFTPNHLFVMAGSGGDRRAPVPVDGFKFRTWIDQDPDGANTHQYGPTDLPSFERVFNTDERMFVQAVTLGTIGDPLPPVVFFAASRENFDTTDCAVTFSSTLYSVGVVSGQPEFDLDSTQPEEDQTKVDNKIQGIFGRDGNLYVTESGGLGASGKVSVWGDNTFDDDPAPPGVGQFTLQLLIEGFRVSPF
jgi:PilY1 beta-propeller domain